MQAAVEEYEIEIMRNEDQQWVRNEIRLATQRSEVQGFKKCLRWLREWSLVGPAVAAFIALLSITVGAIYYSVANVREETVFRTHTGDRLDSIEQILHGLQRAQASTLLSAAVQEAKTGQKENAGRHIQQTVEVLQELTQARISAPASFFESEVNTLNQLRSVGVSDTDIHQASLKLAEYRSSLNPAPAIPKKTADLPQNWQANVWVTVVAAYPVLTTIVFSPPKPVTIVGNGAVFDCRGMRAGQEIMIPATRSLEQNPVVVQGLTFIGAQQSLDYITWENVTFVGTHIKFNGGLARLANVRFVNCTFDLPNNNAGAQIAEYAALQPKQTIKVG